MSELTLRLVLLLLWAAVISLDERAHGSFMLHQPLVSGTVSGALMGNLHGGMSAGLILQCFWPALTPVGGVSLPSAGLAAVVAGAITSWGTHLAGTRLLGSVDGPLLLGVVLGLLTAGAGMSWERATRRRNEVREERALFETRPLKASLVSAMRASYHDSAWRGVVLVGVPLLLAAALFLWPAGVHLLGARPWPHWGAALRISALGLGLGTLFIQLDGFRSHCRKEWIWGVAAGIALQIVRAF